MPFSLSPGDIHKLKLVAIDIDVTLTFRSVTKPLDKIFPSA